MHIFIDESGNFVVPEIAKSKVSSITSLTIPDTYLDFVCQRFLSLRQQWGFDKEVKGRALNEKQISDVISLLRDHDALVEIACLDVGHHSDQGISKYKNAQADKLIEHLTDRHKPSLVAQIRELRVRLLDLPNQLFLQAMVTIHLIKRILDHSPIYFSQRIPKELGSFSWFVDAKKNEGEKTPFEKLWATLLMPILETNYSMGVFEGGDYSHFSKYEVAFDKMTDHQKSLMSKKAIGGVNIKKLITENLLFGDSQLHVGLQLVDIVSSGFTRAMNGNLGFKGWRHIGSLMVKEPTMFLFDTDPTNKPAMGESHGSVITELRSKRKPMLI